MITNLDITQLVENTAGGPGLLAEHGVAIFIEADGKKLLFDTGQGLALRHNVKQLEIPIQRVDAIVLSHGHYDHAGGLVEALVMTGPTDLYLHPKALEPKYNRVGGAIGAPFNDNDKIVSHIRQVIHTKGPTEITEGILSREKFPESTISKIP